MSRKKKKNKQPGQPTEEKSLRKTIKKYRQGLHGDIAEAFDRVFFDETGETGMKQALSNGKNLQKAFAAAKVAADAERKNHPIVEVPFVDEDDE